MWGEIIQALTLGFLYGIGPCTLSCAPLVVPLIMATAKNPKQGICGLLRCLYQGKMRFRETFFDTH